MFTEQMSEALVPMGFIAPSSHTNNTDTTIAGIDMSIIRRLISYLAVGTLGTNANVQLFYYSSANANMAGSTNIGNASSYTTAVLTATTNNRISSLEIRADQLPAGHRYVQPVIIVNAAASCVSLMALGGESSYKPANQLTPVNTVDQRVVVGVS